VTSEEIGPVEYLIVAFPGNEFKGEIAPALAELVEEGTIRIIDIAFVGKDEDGSVAAFELSEIDPDVRAGLEKMGVEVSGLFNEEDLAAAGEELEPNSSAALLVWGGRLGARGGAGDARRGRRYLRLRPAPARGRPGRARLRA
jgi:Family of unknown function (DUF6325)